MVKKRRLNEAKMLTKMLTFSKSKHFGYVFYPFLLTFFRQDGETCRLAFGMRKTRIWCTNPRSNTALINTTAA